mmetsp:Transcript_29279/g.75449  ORF Transcript_29279/g.75449 Transcript_29279/m.75449 type:complete len:228 (-) Transcript_29279:1007-1690(-)
MLRASFKLVFTPLSPLFPPCLPPGSAHSGWPWFAPASRRPDVTLSRSIASIPLSTSSCSFRISAENGRGFSFFAPPTFGLEAAFFRVGVSFATRGAAVPGRCFLSARGVADGSREPVTLPPTYSFLPLSAAVLSLVAGRLPDSKKGGLPNFPCDSPVSPFLLLTSFSLICHCSHSRCSFNLSTWASRSIAVLYGKPALIPFTLLELRLRACRIASKGMTSFGCTLSM